MRKTRENVIRVNQKCVNLNFSYMVAVFVLIAYSCDIKLSTELVERLVVWSVKFLLL